MGASQKARGFLRRVTLPQAGTMVATSLAGPGSLSSSPPPASAPKQPGASHASMEGSMGPAATPRAAELAATA